MLLYELTEANLPPDQDYLALIGDILDDANDEYAKFLKDNNDQDGLACWRDRTQSSGLVYTECASTRQRRHGYHS